MPSNLMTPAAASSKPIVMTIRKRSQLSHNPSEPSGRAHRRMRFCASGYQGNGNCYENKTDM
jgi:hypothetical protein